MRRKCFAFLLALAMCLGLAAPAFAAAEDFVIENGELVEYNGPGGDVAIPDGVTSIGFYAFSDCPGLTSVTIPDTVTKISYDAFSFCTGLTGIVIPDSVTEFGSGIFRNCYRLTSIPKGVTRLTEFMFQTCTGLTNADIPEGVAEIPSYTFSGCTALTSVTIPDSVAKIGYNAFSGCTALTEIVIPEGVTEIGDWAFKDCTALTRVVIPDSVTKIGYKAFMGCSSLTDVTIPENLAESDYDSFQGTPWLVRDGEFRIVDGVLVKYLGKGGGVVIPDGVTEIGGFAFTGEYSKRLTGVTIPKGVAKIGQYAFSGCELLTDVTIPEGVTEIGYMAFSDCPGLTNVTLPASVTEIGQWAFQSVDAPPAGYAPDIWLPDNLVLLAPAGSYAETYAQENDIPFTALIHGFTDLRPDGFYVDAVGWAVANGVTTGKTANTFAPDESCTHGQILTFLWRAAGEPEASVTLPFETTGKEYYLGAAKWAYGKGMVGADFDHKAPCTRADAVSYIWQAFGKPDASCDGKFTDVPAGAAYAQAAAWALDNGVTTGATATTFNPNQICTRGQIVTFLYRAYK